MTSNTVEIFHFIKVIKLIALVINFFHIFLLGMRGWGQDTQPGYLGPHPVNCFLKVPQISCDINKGLDISCYQ